MYIDRKQMACCMWQSREGRYGKHRDKSFGSDRHIHYFDYGDSFTVYMYVTTYHLYTFSSGHVWMWELDCEEGWAPKNWCFWTLVLEKTLESPLDCKEIQPVHPKGGPVLGVHWKDWCWGWNSNTLATLCEELTHWKRPWCWEGLGAGGEGDDRGWDGWMASPTRWTWVWVNPGSWWWTGRPGVLQFMELQRVRHDWATELNRNMYNWLYLNYTSKSCKKKKKSIVSQCVFMKQEMGKRF